MLLDKINENIQHYDFFAAYKDLKKYLKRGNSESRSNTMLRTELDFFHQTYKDRLKNPPIHDIRKISKRLQELAVSIESEIEITHKNWWSWAKILWGGLGFILVNFGVDSCNSYQNLTKFHDENKTHLLVYDFDKFLSNGTYDLEDLIHLSINNNSDSSIWSNYFESNRKTGDKIFNKSFLYSSKFPWSSEWFASTVNWFNVNLKAHHGITGHVQQAKNNTLSIHMEAHDTDYENTISEIHIENLEDVQVLKDNPCALYELIRLIDFKKIETVKQLITDLDKNLNSCQNNMDYQFGLVNEVKELAFKSMRHLKSKEDSIDLLKLLHENIDDLYTKPKQDVCFALKIISESIYNCEINASKNIHPLKKLFNELNAIPRPNGESLNWDEEKKEISLTAYFVKGSRKYINGSDTQKYISNLWEKFDENNIKQNGIFGFKTFGHTCSEGEDDYPNDTLAIKRAWRILDHFGQESNKKLIRKNENEEYYEIHHNDYHTTPTNDAKNRNATIKIFIKENANSGQATLIKNK